MQSILSEIVKIGIVKRAINKEKNGKPFDKVHILKFVVKICHRRRMPTNYPIKAGQTYRQLKKMMKVTSSLALV